MREARTLPESVLDTISLARDLLHETLSMIEQFVWLCPMTAIVLRECQTMFLNITDNKTLNKHTSSLNECLTTISDEY